jgi:hypothetical protein
VDELGPWGWNCAVALRQRAGAKDGTPWAFRGAKGGTRRPLVLTSTDKHVLNPVLLVEVNVSYRFAAYTNENLVRDSPILVGVSFT